MLSVIAKQHKVGEILSSEPFLVEVYASVDFSWYNEDVEFVLLCKDDIDSVKILRSLSDCFAYVRIYPVKDAFSALIKDKRIIWSKNVWYV